jgi:crotonobetainyl-CoA:carnitine CoA-transferase CaiB-like acyl-CoA transferase
LRIGFGDDVAAGAGLVAWDDGTPCPMGDALADPLAGVTAAAAALAALHSGRGALLDVSMHDLCAAAATTPATGRRDVIARAPQARRTQKPAAPLGRDTAAVLAEFGP